MNVNCLEDFISVASTHSFSKSAALRYTSQPALSRRIKSLEEWAGASLLDRSNSPLDLTSAGCILYPYAQTILQSLHEARALLRAVKRENVRCIKILSTPDIASALFPALRALLRVDSAQIPTLMEVHSYEACQIKMLEGQCDILVAPFHPLLPGLLEDCSFKSLDVADTFLAPFSAVDHNNTKAKYFLSNEGGVTPYLGYPAETYIGRLVENFLNENRIAGKLDCVYEAQSVDVIKALVVAGRGIAFLPSVTVWKEIRSAKIVMASPSKINAVIPLKLRLYRTAAQDPIHEEELSTIWELAHELISCTFAETL